MVGAVGTGIENLESIYIGKNSEKLKAKMDGKGRERFSILAFVFGPSYFIARKIYLRGFLLLAFSVILAALAFTFYFPFGLMASVLIYHAILGFLFPGIYRKSIAKRIARIENSSKGKTPEEVRAKIAKKGGLNLFFPVAYNAILLLFVWAFFFVFTINTSFAGEWRGGGGYLVLNRDHTYYWYASDNKDENNYYYGFYLESHRAQTAGNGFVDRPGFWLFHQKLIVDGQKKEMKDYYARTTEFIIGNQAGDTMEVMNLKTFNRYEFKRVK